MWKPLQNTPPYLIKLKYCNDCYEIDVTDYQRSWITLMSKLNFLDSLKNSNDGLEFDDENELVERGLDMLENPQTLKKVKIILEEKKLDMEMTKMYEFPLKLELSLVEASYEHLFQTVIQPLLKTVCDLRSSQFELRELLKKKDKEIDRFRTEGQVPRRDKTKVYNDTAHMIKHTAYEEFFGAPDMPDLLQAGADVKVNKPQPKPTRSDQITVRNGQGTSESKTLHHPTENSNLPYMFPKVEKCSQTAPNGDIQPSLSKTVKKEDSSCDGILPESNVKVKKEIKPETKDPMPRKRQKHMLNY